MPARKRTADGKVLLPMEDGTEQAFIFTEDLVPAYTLDNLLLMDNGQPVTSAAEWKKRRKELFEKFEEHVFGKTPQLPYGLSIAVIEDWSPALDGTARRKQLRLIITTEFGSQTAEMLLYAPLVDHPVPAFLGLNFGGNQTIEPDLKICITTSWVPDLPEEGMIDHRATEMSRGSSDSRWPVKMILKEGFALATLYYGDFDPDFDDGFQNGLHAIFHQPGQQRNPADWGAIGAWAFGLSRALDALEQEPVIDASRVTAIGHSRLGKTALWAAAQDERFYAVIDNESGCGGSALNQRCFGENIKAITTRFPHWFCGNYAKYSDNEAAIPIDTHGLLALIAPRPLYVAAAAEDLWSDPRGMFLAQKAAAPVYEFLGKKGLPMDELPAISQTDLSGRQAYHLRPGQHDLTLFDWIQFLRFIKSHQAED